jgi:GrpB-like predicted nucleotidyltransferase (UPF0157 family)
VDRGAHPRSPGSRRARPRSGDPVIIPRVSSGSTALRALAIELMTLALIFAITSSAPTPTQASTGFVSAHGSRPDSPGIYRDIPRPGDLADAALYAKRLFHNPKRAAMLHIRRADSPFAQFVVLFRGWLRSNPEEANRYQQVKRRLAEHHAGDGDYDDYTRNESAFFDETNDEMQTWA